MNVVASLDSVGEEVGVHGVGVCVAEDETLTPIFHKTQLGSLCGFQSTGSLITRSVGELNCHSCDCHCCVSMVADVAKLAHRKKMVGWKQSGLGSVVHG